NMLQVVGEQQVQLEVSFAEVSRSALKQMGFNFWHKGTGPDRAFGVVNPSQNLQTITPSTQTPAPDPGLQTTTPILSSPLSQAFGLVFALGSSSDFPFSATLNVLANNGYARTLAEPTLVALSGQEANFLAGGEFPVPLPQGLGTLAINYKKFGIQLKFLPTVL